MQHGRRRQIVASSEPAGGSDGPWSTTSPSAARPSDPTRPPAAARAERFFSVARAEMNALLDAATSLVRDERAVDPDDASLEQVDHALERLGARAHARRFQIAVVALVKSGKSTLINALLGAEYLPRSNVPETARIVRVRHDAAVPTGRLSEGGRVVAEGAPAVCAYLRARHAEVRRDGQPPPDELVLDAPFEALRGRAVAAQSFEVLDTPGPNEAGAEALRGEVDRLLSQSDVVIHLLDYTKLRTEEERALLARLHDLRPELLGHLSDRLFFAVNKVDQVNSNGLGREETRQYVADLLAAALPGTRVTADRVLLLSAEQALLARVVGSDEASPGAVRDFARLCFGFRAHRRIGLAECRAQAPMVLEDSLLPELETQVLTHLYEQRGRLELEGLAGALERQLGKVDNHFATSARALALEKDQLAERSETLTGEHRAIEAGLDELGALAEASVDRVAGWVCTRFGDLRDRLAVDLRAACERAAGPLPDAWERLRVLLATADGDAIRSAKGATRLIAEAHQQITAALQSELAAFWTDLEIGAYEQQRALITEIEAQLAPFAARIEEAVSRRLEIPLAPVRLSLPVPSFEEVRSEVGRQVDALVERRTRMEKTVEAQTVRTRRTGLCSQDAFQSVSVPVVREVAVFDVSREKLIAQWRDWLGTSTDASIQTARAIVRERVGGVVRAARVELAAYRDGYTRAVRRALDESVRGGEERRRRLESVQAAERRLHGLRARLARCHEFLLPDPDEEGVT